MPPKKITKISKKEAQRKHAKRRAQERYGLEFSGKVRRAFLELIRNNETILIVKQSNRVTIRSLLYESRLYYVIVDHKRQEIISFLTPDQIHTLLSNDEFEW